MCRASPEGKPRLHKTHIVTTEDIAPVDNDEADDDEANDDDDDVVVGGVVVLGVVDAESSGGTTRLIGSDDGSFTLLPLRIGL